VGDAEYARRVNAAAELVESGAPAAEAAGALAGRSGARCGRPAGMWTRAAAAAGCRCPSERGVHRQAARGAGRRVRAYARERETTISAVVARALTEFFARGRRQPPRR